MLAYVSWAGIDDQETFVDVLKAIDDEFVSQTNTKIEKRIERESKKYGNKRHA